MCPWLLLFLYTHCYKDTQFKYDKALQILCITMWGLLSGMQHNGKLSHALFSKTNANSVTCQVENILPKLFNDCSCVRSEPHATQLPTESNTHYLCDIIPPSDRLRHSAHCFLCCTCHSLLVVFLVHILTSLCCLHGTLVLCSLAYVKLSLCLWEHAPCVFTSLPSRFLLSRYMCV